MGENEGKTEGGGDAFENDLQEVEAEHVLEENQAGDEEPRESLIERVIAAARVAGKLRTKEEVSLLATFLLSVPKLKHFQPATAMELAQRMKAVDVQPEEFVFMQGEPPKAYYVMVDGKCSLYIRDERDEGIGRETKNLRSRDGIGENELMEGGVRPWSCKAVEPTTLLEVDAEFFRRVLSGGFVKAREEKITFLASLPQFKGMPRDTLRRIAHCFHEREFDPREIVVRQGQPSRHLFVIKSGQVSVFIDPDYDATNPLCAAETDPRHCMQVCLLGAGTFIGDMSLDGSRRAATVIALHAVVTYKVRRMEFKRIMPPQIIDQMRRVAEEKARFQKEHVARKATALRDTILLGPRKIPVPKKLLRGYGLRRLGTLLGTETAGKSSMKVNKLQRMVSGTCTMPPVSPRGAPATPRGQGNLEADLCAKVRSVAPIRCMLGQEPSCDMDPKATNTHTTHNSGLSTGLPAAITAIEERNASPPSQRRFEKRPLVPQTPQSPRRTLSNQAPLLSTASGSFDAAFKSRLINAAGSLRPRTPRGRASPRRETPLSIPSSGRTLGLWKSRSEVQMRMDGESHEEIPCATRTMSTPIQSDMGRNGAVDRADTGFGGQEDKGEALGRRYHVEEVRSPRTPRSRIHFRTRVDMSIISR